MNKLVFIGGCKGVGKSGLAESLSTRLGYSYVHTGTICRLDRDKFEENLIELLSTSNDNLILDSHYIVNSSKAFYDFHQGLSNEALKTISKTKMDKLFVNIVANPKTIMERRCRDGDPRRCMNDLTQIMTEHNLGVSNAIMYSQIMKGKLFMFVNDGITFDEAKRQLYTEVKKYV